MTEQSEEASLRRNQQNFASKTNQIYDNEGEIIVIAPPRFSSHQSSRVKSSGFCPKTINFKEICIIILLVGIVWLFFKLQSSKQPTLIIQKQPNQIVDEKKNHQKIENLQTKNEISTPKSNILPQNTNMKQSSQAVVRQSIDLSDYNMSQSFNLWDMSPSEKRTLLKKFKQLPETLRKIMKDDHMEINYDDEVFQQHTQKYEQNSEVIDWAAIDLTEAEKTQIANDFKTELAKRKPRIKFLRDKKEKQFQGKNGHLDAKKDITYQEFLEGIDYMQFVGFDYKTDPELKQLYEREKKHYDDKFKTNSYSKELHACVIVPSFKNNADFRYAWNIESIMQQEYSNFRVIIVDDASPDKTGEVLAKYLRWRDFPRDKIVLLRSKQRRTAAENFYYAVHKYCDFNQIFYTVDGDDQLIGSQVFRLFNAVYQSTKYYVLYSNYIWQKVKDQNKPASLGISLNYEQATKKKNDYKGAQHLYSHERTMMTDLFLFTRVESLYDENGKFYWAVPDDAIYLPALQLSCGRNKYVSAINYRYKSDTGNNQYFQNHAALDKVFKHIRQKQKKYHCINNLLTLINSTLESSNKTL